MAGIVGAEKATLEAEIMPACPKGLSAVVEEHATLGLCIRVPVSRFSAALVAWLLSVVGLVSSISTRTVQRWLSAERLKPWRFRSWITPKDLKSFLERAMGILGLYERVAKGQLEPGEVVECLDEKTSIQGRSRDSYRAPSKGEPARVEHTYKRRGAVQLFGALDVATGSTAEQIHKSKDFATFSTFLSARLESLTAAGARVIHFIMDNGSLHRPKYLATWVAEWLRERGLKHVEVLLHWLPPRSSWLNQVEIVFSLVQTHALTPNNFESTDQVAARILSYLALRRESPRPMKWTYTGAQLCQKYEVDPANIVPTPPTRITATATT